MSAHGAAGPRAGGRAGRTAWEGLPARRDERTERREERPDGAGHQPDLRVVEPRRDQAAARRRRIRLAVLGAGTFVAVVVFGLVGVHVVLAQNQFRLDRLNASAAKEEAQYQRLRLQVDQLEAPQRIVATAEGKLGMVPPAGVTYLTPPAPPPPSSASATSGSRPLGPVASASPSTTIPAAGDRAGDWASVKPHLVARP